MSKPSAFVSSPRQHIKKTVSAVPPDKEEIVVAHPIKGSTDDPSFRTIVLSFWWKKAPDLLLPPRIAQTEVEWKGEWYTNPHAVQVWDDTSHSWVTWWKADYALPLTARVVRGLERIRTLPQEEW